MVSRWKCRRPHGLPTLQLTPEPPRKSRLILEFRQSLAGDDVTWLEGQCSSYGKKIAYLPIADCLKHSFRIEEADSEAEIIAKLDAVAEDWTDELKATLPFVRFLLSVDPGDAAVLAMDAQVRRAAIFSALRVLLLQQARQRPAVLLFEDPHWIDEQSEEAIASLVDVAAGSPVMLLLTHRPEYASRLGQRSFYHRIALNHLNQEQSLASATSSRPDGSGRRR